MVKLFVGNLAECVDSHRLKNLFLQENLNVQECDVLKNFAFVHVATEEDATTAIEKLDKSLLEGREIHIERSTSRLRKEPGMGDCCYTCGAQDHKTPQCPQEQGRRKNIKRPGDENDIVSAAKRANTALPSTPAAGSCWGYKLPTVVDNDPELACPANPELRALYDQYKDARSRYHYFRDRLQKELTLQAANGNAAAATGSGPVRIDLTRTVQPPQQLPTVPVVAPTPPVVHQPYPAYATSAYRPQNYPGATAVSAAPSSSTSYPGAQATVYTAQTSAYGQQPIQHYSTPYSQSNDVKPSTQAYQRPSSYSSYK